MCVLEFLNFEYSTFCRRNNLYEDKKIAKILIEEYVETVENRFG